MKFAYHGEKKVKLDVAAARVSPVSANPPPKPPSTFSSDKLAQGRKRERGDVGSSESKGGVPKGKMILKGKTAKTIPKAERH